MRNIFRGSVAEFQHKHAARLEQRRRLLNQRGVNFCPSLAAEKRHGRLVITDFAREPRRFPEANVRRVAGDQIEGR